MSEELIKCRICGKMTPKRNPCCTARQDVTTEEKLKEARAEKARLEALKEKHGQEANKIRSQMYAERKPYEVKLDEINEKYRPAEEVAEKEASNASSAAWKKGREIYDLQCELKIEAATQKGYHNEESVEAFMEQCNINVDNILEKKPLKNNIQIFRATDGGEYSNPTYTMWLAFRGLDLVGISYRRAGAHRGDDTTPYSFIGGFETAQVLILKLETNWSKRYNSNPKEYEFIQANFTQWAKELAERDAASIKAIPITTKLKEALDRQQTLDGIDITSYGYVIDQDTGKVRK